LHPRQNPGYSYNYASLPGCPETFSDFFATKAATNILEFLKKLCIADTVNKNAAANATIIYYIYSLGGAFSVISFRMAVIL